MLNLISRILVAVGGINWGLVGIGNFMGYDLNLVSRLFGSFPVIENIIYILVGIAAILMFVVRD